MKQVENNLDFELRQNFQTTFKVKRSYEGRIQRNLSLMVNERMIEKRNLMISRNFFQVFMKLLNSGIKTRPNGMARVSPKPSTMSIKSLLQHW